MDCVFIFRIAILCAVCYNLAMSNAIEFISAYNTIDAALRSIYKGKGSLQFSDLVRRCAVFHRVVRKYEEELLTYAKLRNAIVHNSTTERVIAEPCKEVTEEMQLIARLLSDPPKLSRLKSKKLVGINGDKLLSEAIVLMSEMGISNVPVYEGERFKGFINNRRVARLLGAVVRRGESVDEFLARTLCRDALNEEDMRLYYKALRESDGIQEAIDAFSENKKLIAVVVVDSKRHSIQNLLTVADLPEMMRIVDEA